MQNILTKDAPSQSSNNGAIALDVKSISEDGTFEGYGAIFGNIDRGRDKIMPGAFAKSLRSKDAIDVMLLRSHDGNKVIGKWLEIREDKKGLFCKGQIFKDVELGAETLLLMREKVLNGLSIGYMPTKRVFVDGDNNGTPDHRELHEVDLWEISVVTFAMNEKAKITDVKSDLTKRDIENILRDASVPNQFAKMIVAHGYDEASDRTKSRREGGLDGKSIAGEIDRISKILEG